MRSHLVLIVFAVCSAFSIAAAAAAQPAPSSPTDYTDPSAWVCRPGQEAACTTGLDAMVVAADGTRTRQTFVPASDPPIDCFYVYPTVSLQPGDYSDMTPAPEVVGVVHAQAARLTSRCRLYAPIYRQITLAALNRTSAEHRAVDWSGPYQDVRAAWRWYMAHANQGRGVVLIGHSQGTILLQRLIAEEIDGKPAQARLVSAFLAGDPSLPVPAGRREGGVFKHVPLCAAASETGCVYVWASYLSDDGSTDRLFGRSRGGGLTAGCVNPASPAGGSGELKAYLSKPPFAPADDPPAVEVEGQLSAACVADAQGDVLRITIQPTAFSQLLQVALHKYEVGVGWGLHRLDLSLPQGNILDLVEAETQTWTRR